MSRVSGAVCESDMSRISDAACDSDMSVFQPCLCSSLIMDIETRYDYSQLSLSRSFEDYFLQVQITRIANLFALRVIWTCKKVSNAKLWSEKAVKMYFYSERRFEFRRIRDIRVRDIESRL